MNWLDKAQKQIEELTPEVGFNVVAIDDGKFAGDDDALYFVAHFEDLAQAEKARSEHERETGDTSYIYGPKEAL